MDEESEGKRATAVRLSPLPQSHGLAALEPVADQCADDKGRNGKQPDIPTCPKRGVMHDHSSGVCAGL